MIRSTIPLAIVWLLFTLRSADGQTLPRNPDYPDPLNEFVAVGTSSQGQTVVLATVGPPRRVETFYRSVGDALWRFRLIRPVGKPPLDQPLLSQGATKLFVRTAGGHELIDLSRDLKVIPLAEAGPLGTHSHILPGQLFPVINDDGMLEFYEDVGANTAKRCADCRFVSDATTLPCTVAARLVRVAPDQTVVVVARDGVVCRSLPLRDRIIELKAVGRLQSGQTSTSLIVGQHGIRIVARSKSDAVVLVDENGHDVGTSRPLSPQQANLTALEQVSGLSTQYDPADVAKLASMLEREASKFLRQRGMVELARAGMTWTFFPLIPDARPYAPVLEFAPGESVYPTTFDVWPRLRRHAPSALAHVDQLTDEARERAYLEAYRYVGKEQLGCNIYWRVRYFPGSWLLEYWLYYPFDVGQGHHFHDAEHIFVEVDKLGGTIRQVIGAAHGAYASNNVYKADRLTVPGASLPIFAFVEAGKHAMSPDINRDGVFNIGGDVNYFRDRAKIWGVRDLTALTDSNLRSYDGTMTLPRGAEDRRAVSSYTAFFASAEHGPATLAAAKDHALIGGLSPAACDCSLTRLALPTQLSCSDEKKEEEDCAQKSIAGNPDYQNWDSILKPTYSPPFILRLGIAAEPVVSPEGVTRQPALTFGAAVDISVLTPDALSFPGRISIDGMFLGQTGNGVHGSSLRYERLKTNLWGQYAGIKWLRNSSSSSGYTTWLEYGQMLEFAPSHIWNVSVQLGLAYSNGQGLRFESRFLLLLPTRSQFGIAAGSQSPY